MHHAVAHYLGGNEPEVLEQLHARGVGPRGVLLTLVPTLQVKQVIGLQGLFFLMLLFRLPYTEVVRPSRSLL